MQLIAAGGRALRARLPPFACLGTHLRWWKNYIMANEQIAAQLDSGDHEGFWLSVIDRGKIHWGMFWCYLRVAVADYYVVVPC